VRIDRLLVERGLVPNRELARRLVMAGEVLVGDRPVTKPGAEVADDAALRLRTPASPYASRGGEKLAGALDAFGIDPTGLLALDVGASTGGFTDCLLRRGARGVIAVDVGYGQLAWKLQQDPRVTVIDRTNARHLEPGQLPEPADLATVDVSFISLAKVLPAVAACVRTGGSIVALVKPQFEVGRSRVGKGGVVRDDAARADAVAAVRAAAEALGLVVQGEAESVLPGPKGNREVFLWLAR
jgi:23S rRNA (cytidine1920-2'-O)/16S rRNA (cytidine1409-2'-O)-methyltransferase